MKRNLLVDAVRRTAEELGYAFHTGPDKLIPARVRSLPAVWLSPAKLTSHEGRHECRDTYSLNLYFMMAAAQGGRDAAESALHVLECDAAELFARLPDDAHVTHAEGLKCSPVLSGFTKDGEVALVAEMRAGLFYCH